MFSLPGLVSEVKTSVFTFGLALACLANMAAMFEVCFLPAELVVVATGFLSAAPSFSGDFFLVFENADSMLLGLPGFLISTSGLGSFLTSCLTGFLASSTFLSI